MNRCDISFIVPAYNASKYILRTICEILKIKNIEIECIVVDDGSIDGTEAIVNEIAMTESRIKFIKKENGGVSSARNIGLAHASGEFVCFVDADDTVNPTFFSDILMNDLRKNDVCMFSYQEIYQDGTVKKKHADMRDGLTSRQLIDRLLDCQYSVNHDSNYIGGKVYQYLINREFLSRNNIFFSQQIHFAEDMLFCIELFANNPQIICLDEIGYSYFVRSNTASHKYREAYWIEHKAILKKIEMIQSEYRIYTECDFKQVYNRLKLFYIKDVIAHNARYSIKNYASVLQDTKRMLCETDSKRVIEGCNWENWTRSEAMINYWLIKKASVKLLIYFVWLLFRHKIGKKLKYV